MADRPPPEDAVNHPEDSERIKRLKQASRLIITSRERMPHSAQWHLSLRRTLWRYTQEVLLRKRRNESTETKATKEKNHDS
jgi:hypothetical protein